MNKRVTVVLDDDLIKKLRDLQAMKITKTRNTVSFSSVICEVLENGLKN